MKLVDALAYGDASQEELRADLMELYDLLLSQALLETRAEVLVIVPDRSVAAIPFAALYHGQTSSFLVEEKGVVVTPNLAILARASRSLLAPEVVSETSVLSIGEPHPRPHLPIVLGPLPLATEEARQVAALYPRSTVLVGESATKTSFLDSAPHHQVIHYAGHSTVDPFVPYRSLLHLTPSSDVADGDLTSTEIRRLQLPSTRLVVLSSCSSTLDRSVRERAPFGLGGAFVAAGVPSVVGALWAVDDAPTAQFMIELHHSLRAGREPVDALRETQLRRLRSGAPELATVRVWGAFRLLGGVVHRP